jgi:DNA-directed RNA polymerase beta' subunit
MQFSTKTSGYYAGLSQDTLSGTYLVSSDTKMTDKRHMMRLFNLTRETSYPSFNQKSYNYNDIHSILLEHYYPINYKRSSYWYDTYNNYLDIDPKYSKIIIEKGKIKCGVLDKNSVSGGINSIFHNIENNYHNKGLDAMFNLQHVALQYLMQKGFTISLGDFYINKESRYDINKIISNLLFDIKLINDDLLSNKIVSPIGKTITEFYELKMKASLKLPDIDIVKAILKSVNTDMNGLYHITSSGTGSINNAVYISALLGQMNINGNRIKEKFSLGRATPYYPAFSLDPKARGLILNNYIEGLTLIEFVYSSQKGRDDLIGKYIKTAMTGHQHRKSSLSLQDIISDNMRNCMNLNKFVNFLYGDDGFDPRKLTNVEIKLLNMTNEQIKKLIPVKYDALYSDIITLRNELQLNLITINNYYHNKYLDKFKMIPVNINMILNNHAKHLSILNNKDILNNIKFLMKFCKRIPSIYTNSEYIKKDGYEYKNHINGCKYIISTIYTSLLPIIDKIEYERLKVIFDEIYCKCLYSLIHYGICVGIHATQAVCEPLTQIMLNSHRSTKEDDETKFSVSRIQEVLNLTNKKKEKIVGMYIPLLDEKYKEIIINKLNLTYLKDFVIKYELIYENINKIKSDDRYWINYFLSANPLYKIPQNITNWCLCLNINKEELLVKKTTIYGIISVIYELYNNVYIVYTPETVKTIKIRIYISDETCPTEIKMRQFSKDILNVKINGIDNAEFSNAVCAKKNYIDKNNNISEKNINIIRTSGSNLYDVIYWEGIDKNNLMTSSILDTYTYLGIEAARTKIITELNVYLGNSTPNNKHLIIHADEMTRMGFITSLDRGGMKIRNKSNVLLRMGMFAPIQVLTDATINNLENSVDKSITTSMMMGKVPKIGSNYNDILLNEDFIKENSLVDIHDVIRGLGKLW